MYLTSSTTHTVARSPDGGYYDTMRSATLSAVRGSATGRLLRFDPRTRRTTELLGGLSFANGAAARSKRPPLGSIVPHLSPPVPAQRAPGRLRAARHSQSGGPATGRAATASGARASRL